MHGGEVFVPKIPSMRITDLAQAVALGVEVHETGIRPGEKLHEEMISVDDARRTSQFPTHYAIHPVLAEWETAPVRRGSPVPEDFSYNSRDNQEWLSVEQLAKLVDTLDAG